MFLRFLSRGRASVSSSLLTGRSGYSTGSTTEMNPAMKFYLSKKRAHDAFMAAERDAFEQGKTQLGQIMGTPSQALTQEEVDRAIEYLFPSGLINPRARPVLKPPEAIYPKEKDAEFDLDGRPFHPFFYCVSSNFIQKLHDLVDKHQMLQILEERPTKLPQVPLDGSFFSGSIWVTREDLEDTFLEDISPDQYKEFIEVLERLSVHPFAYKIKDFLSHYRKSLGSNEEQAGTPLDHTNEFIQPQFDEKGSAYVETTGQRKSSVARVKVTKPGSGAFSIVHLDYPEDIQGIQYFDNYMDRHQILFPLQLTRLLGSVDVECVVYAGGSSGQAGAVRYALSMCLKSFVDADTVNDMKLMGLLTQDIRVRERKRFGHVKSRKKFKYKKR